MGCGREISHCCPHVPEQQGNAGPETPGGTKIYFRELTAPSLCSIDLAGHIGAPVSQDSQELCVDAAMLLSPLCHQQQFPTAMQAQVLGTETSLAVLTA